MKFTMSLAVILGVVVIGSFVSAVTYPIVQLVNPYTINTSYVDWQSLNMTNSTYDAWRTSKMDYSAWNATNESYLTGTGDLNTTGWLNGSNILTKGATITPMLNTTAISANHANITNGIVSSSLGIGTAPVATFPLTMQQGADYAGLKLKGFDDQSTATQEMYMSGAGDAYWTSSGSAYLRTDTGYIYIRPAATTVGFFRNTGFGFYDNMDFELGSSTTSSSIIRENTANNNKTLYLGLSDGTNGSKRMIVGDYGDRTSNFNIGPAANPTISLFSSARTNPTNISSDGIETAGNITFNGVKIQLKSNGNLTYWNTTTPFMCVNNVTGHIWSDGTGGNC